MCDNRYIQQAVFLYDWKLISKVVKWGMYYGAYIIFRTTNRCNHFPHKKSAQTIWWNLYFKTHHAFVLIIMPIYISIFTHVIDLHMHLYWKSMCSTFSFDAKRMILSCIEVIRTDDTRAVPICEKHSQI